MKQSFAIGALQFPRIKLRLEKSMGVERISSIKMIAKRSVSRRDRN
ncbi:MAG: hypothetical protein IPJ84_12665 [Bdellovibrionales bacterium]|nr:hypothetical protein [Bdellovibrionales bacterium]